MSSLANPKSHLLWRPRQTWLAQTRLLETIRKQHQTVQFQMLLYLLSTFVQPVIRPEFRPRTLGKGKNILLPDLTAFILVVTEAVIKVQLKQHSLMATAIIKTSKTRQLKK